MFKIYKMVIKFLILINILWIFQVNLFYLNHINFFIKEIIKTILCPHRIFHEFNYLYNCLD